MQTFLPYPDFERTAAVLDRARLGKQRVEAFQILRALVLPTYGWKHHPAVKMWVGYEQALITYGVVMCQEWVGRGHPDTVEGQLLEHLAGPLRSQAELADLGLLPPWIGSTDVHRSHQSALVRKLPEHYRARFPDVPDDLPYVWPTKVAGPRP